MYMYSGAFRAMAYRPLSTYIPSLNFKKNKGTSSRRDFRRKSDDFFQSRIVLEDPRPESTWSRVESSQGLTDFYFFYFNFFYFHIILKDTLHL